MNNEIVSELKNYLERIENEITFYKFHLENNLKYISELEQYLESNAEKVNNNEEFWFHVYEMYHSYFPYIVNGSLLVTFDSYFEDRFFTLIKILSSENDTKITKNKNESLIVCYFKHLNCNLNTTISIRNYDWLFILKMHRVRNLIVHNNSSLINRTKEKLDVHNFDRLINTNDRKSIRSFRDSIEFNELTGKFYIIDVSLLIKHLDCIKSFFNTVISIHLDD